MNSTPSINKRINEPMPQLSCSVALPHGAMGWSAVLYIMLVLGYILPFKGVQSKLS